MLNEGPLELPALTLTASWSVSSNPRLRILPMLSIPCSEARRGGQQGVEQELLSDWEPLNVGFEFHAASNT